MIMMQTARKVESAGDGFCSVTIYRRVINIQTNNETHALKRIDGRVPTWARPLSSPPRNPLPLSSETARPDLSRRVGEWGTYQKPVGDPWGPGHQPAQGPQTPSWHA